MSVTVSYTGTNVIRTVDQLVQWTVGQTLTVIGLAFSGKLYARCEILGKSSEALTSACEGTSGDVVVCPIPDDVLSKNGTLVLNLTDVLDDKSTVVCTVQVPVRNAAKPMGWIPDPDKVITIDKLIKQVDEAVEKANTVVEEAKTATDGAEKVNAYLSGTTLTVTNRDGASTSANVQGPKGEQGETDLSKAWKNMPVESSDALAYGDDLNSISATCTRFSSGSSVTSGISNVPDGVTDQFVVYTIAVEQDPYRLGQILYAVDSDGVQTWARSGAGSSWSEWANESARATAAEKVNAKSIANEVKRAQTIENELATGVSNAVSAVNTEQERATAVEKVNAKSIANAERSIVEVVGLDSYVLPDGSKFALISYNNKSVSVSGGTFCLQGKRGTLSDVTWTVTAGSSGTYRHDIVGFKYTASTNEFSLVTVKGSKATSKDAAVDPDFDEGDLLAGDAAMPMYRVKLFGTIVQKPEPLFSVLTPVSELASSLSALKATVQGKVASPKLTTKHDGFFISCYENLAGVVIGYNISPAQSLAIGDVVMVMTTEKEFTTRGESLLRGTHVGHQSGMSCKWGDDGHTITLTSEQADSYATADTGSFLIPCTWV